MGGKYLVTTFGCKVNQYESQLLRETCESAGWQPAQPAETADLVIVNTCAVTADALSDGRRVVRRLTRDRRTRVVVVGCGASAQPNSLNTIDGVIAVWGHDTDVRANLRALLPTLSTNPQQSSSGSPGFVACDGERTDENGYEQWMIAAETANLQLATPPRRYSSPRMMESPLPVVNTGDSLSETVHRFEGRARAYVKVQDGCDAHCTYCIIPSLRTQLRSKPIETVVREVRQLTQSGHREVVLTGIFLGAYGCDTAIRRRQTTRPSSLARLVDAVSRIEGLDRLRLSSLEPGDVSDELLDVLANRRACVPHLHLPLQSGSPDVLRRMNRQYTVDQFIDMVRRVRTALDRPAITTDIIVGFPDESDRDFEASVEMARYAEFCKIHAFPFSPREGTAAAKWTRQFVHGSLVRQRMSRLAEVERETSYAFRSRFAGHTERVIVESGEPPRERESNILARLDSNSSSGTPVRFGHSDRYFPVYFQSASARPGDPVSVLINRVTPGRTHGELTSSRRIPLTVVQSV